MTEPKPDPEWISQAARAASMRSAWGRWLYDHHDEFERALLMRPLWRGLLETLAARGVPVELPPEWNDEDDRIRELTRKRVVKARRLVWHRVRTSVRASASQAAAAATAGPLPGAVPAVRDAAVEPEAQPRRAFHPVRPK